MDIWDIYGDVKVVGDIRAARAYGDYEHLVCLRDTDERFPNVFSVYLVTCGVTSTFPNGRHLRNLETGWRGDGELVLHLDLVGPVFRSQLGERLAGLRLSRLRAMERSLLETDPSDDARECAHELASVCQPFVAWLTWGVPYEPEV